MGEWTLMCPNECPHLYDSYGEEFERLYEGYEKANKGRKTVRARELWEKILESQIEQETLICCTKMRQIENRIKKNLGTIRSSNLCTEIMEYTAKDEVAVCNLASISIPMFVSEGADAKNYLTIKNYTMSPKGNS